MPFGSDALEQVVRLLVEVGGLSDVDQLNSLIAKYRQEQKLAVEAGRAAGASMEELTKIGRQYESAIQMLGRSVAAFKKVEEDTIKTSQDWLAMQESLRAAAEATAKTTTDAAEATADAAKQGVADVKAAMEADAEWIRMKERLGEYNRRTAEEEQQAARDRVTQHQSSVDRIKEAEADREADRKEAFKAEVEDDNEWLRLQQTLLEMEGRRREEEQQAARDRVTQHQSSVDKLKEEQAATDAAFKAEMDALDKTEKAQNDQIARTAKAADRYKESWLNAYDRSEKAAQKAADAIKAYEEDKSRTNRAKAEAAIEQADRLADAELKAANKRVAAAEAAFRAIEAAGGDATDAAREVQGALAAVDNATSNVAKAGNQTKTVFSRESWGERNAQGILHVAHAFQDLQYGVGAVLNNIPLLAQALDLPAQKAGALMIAAVGLDLVWRKGEPVIREYATAVGLLDDVTKKAANTAEEAEAKFKALSDKPHKVAVDFAALDAAQERLDKLRATEAAYEASKESKPEKDLAGRASDVVAGHLGGSDALRGVVAATEKASGFNHASAEDQELLKRLKYQLEHPEIDARTGLEKVDPQTVKRQIAETEARMERAAMDYAGREVGRFAAGDPGAIRAMKNRALAHPGAFARKGLDGLTGAEAIADLPGTVEEAAGRRRVEEEIAATDEADADNLKRFKAALEAKAAKRKEAAKQAADSAKREDEEEREIDKFLESEAKHKQAVFEQGVKTREKFLHDESRDKAKAEKEAPKLAQEAQERDMAELFRRRTGATPDLSAEAGRRMAKLVDQGFGVEQAGAAVLNDLARYLNKQEQMGLRQMALMEGMSGAIGPALQRLAVLEAGYEQLEMQSRMAFAQGRTRRPSRLPRGN